MPWNITVTELFGVIKNKTVEKILSSKEICVDGLCGIGENLAKELSPIDLFSAAEYKEANELAKLAESVRSQASLIVTNPDICKGLKAGESAAIDQFTKLNANGIVTHTVQVVCAKGILKRAVPIIKNACLNLVGC